MRNPLTGESTATIAKSIATAKQNLRHAWRQLSHERRTERRRSRTATGTVHAIYKNILTLKKLHRRAISNGFHEEIDVRTLERTIAYHERKRARLITSRRTPTQGASSKHCTFNRKFSETTQPIPHYYDM